MTDDLVHKSKTYTTVSSDDKSVGHFSDISLSERWSGWNRVIRGCEQENDMKMYAMQVFYSIDELPRRRPLPRVTGGWLSRP
jgi:hypothetical protein